MSSATKLLIDFQNLFSTKEITSTSRSSYSITGEGGLPVTRGFLVSYLQNTLREEDISRLWKDGMWLLCCQSYKDALSRAPKCTLMTGQPTIDWLGYLTSVHTKSWFMPRISWIRALACTRRKWSQRGANSSWAEIGEKD